MKFHLGLLALTAALFWNAPAQAGSAQERVTVKEVVDTAARAGCVYDTREAITLFNLRDAIVCPEQDGKFKYGPSQYYKPVERDEAIKIIVKVPPKILRSALEQIRENYPAKFATEAPEPSSVLEPALSPLRR